MNNLCHKVAFASVCTILSFALVTNKEAKAAVFTLTPTTTFTVGNRQAQDGVGDYIYDNVPLPVGIVEGEGNRQEYRALYEFSVANLFLPPNTAISSAILGVRADTISWYGRFARLNVHGYIGNGQVDVSDFEAGEYLNGQYLYSPTDSSSGINSLRVFNFNVLPFISQKINNNDTFAGFSLRTDEGYLAFNQDARLTIITVDVAEPVPEPTTIFTAAIALGWGGWLKRKNSSQ